MKIFYAVQATGNGHISRAMELLPYLEKYGTVDIFLSGNNSTLNFDLPVAYRSKGLSFKYSGSGGLNYLKTAKEILFSSVIKEARQLPLEKYDLIINDYESITSLACRIKKLESLHFGHQASFVSKKSPRPKQKNFIGESVLKYYARGTKTVGLHFQPYDSFILPPVIKKEIWNAQPTDQGYITVYLPSYADEELIKIFSSIKDFNFEIFSRSRKTPESLGNITLLPVSKDGFNKSMIHCYGIITGAGFETPAEAIYLKKKILLIPIKGQYEQFCNAEALARMGYTIINKIDKHFIDGVSQWLNKQKVYTLKTNNLPTEIIVEKAMHIALSKYQQTKAPEINTFQAIT